MIKFNSSYIAGKEIEYISDTILNGTDYNKKCIDFLSDYNSHIFLVHSCTAALEISALALDISSGDEVIMPSYTYVSTGNAFLLRGAKIIFVDVDQNMNIDLEAVKNAITDKTKAIVPVHYGGISCDMDKLLEIAKNIPIIEDAAQGIYSKYKNRYLGTMGNIGCISLHETKNINSKNGGILLVNDKSLIKKIEKIIEKGTDRIEYLKGNVNKYSWKSIGSSYSMSSLNSAYLYGQLEKSSYIVEERIRIFNKYKEGLNKLIDKNFIEVMNISKCSTHNGHMFFIKLKNEIVRDDLIKFLEKKEIQTATHYEPLHNSKKGKEVGEFVFDDVRTTKDAKRLLRLPLHLNLKDKDIEYIIKRIEEFFHE